MQSQTENNRLICKQSEPQGDDIVEDIMSNLCSREEEQFKIASKLQRLLKDQHLLLTTEQQQKGSFQKKLQSTLFSYYRGTVHNGEPTYPGHTQSHKGQKNGKLEGDKNGEQGEGYEKGRRLFDDQGFGDVYTFVKEVMLTLSKNPPLMMVLIQKYEYTSNIDSLTSLFKSVVNSMYDNIVDDDVFNKDILKIIIFCLKKITATKKHYFQINFQEEQLCNYILREVIDRSEIKQYAKQVTKSTLLQLAKVDHAIDFKQIEEDRLLHEKSLLKMNHKESSKSREESPIKVNRNSSSSEDKKSKIRIYSQGLRQHDEKIKRGVSVKRKYKNCTSQQLLNYLGINQEINFPCFSCSNTEEREIDKQINKQLGMMMNRNQIKNESQFHPDSLLLKNIVLIFFNDLFKMLYSMPALIRISCKILNHYLSQRFNNKNCIYVLADFVINFWLSSALHVDTIEQASKLSPYLRHNVQEVMSVIRNIVKDNSKDINQGFIRQFHLLVTNLKVSIANYIHQVINIDSNKIEALCEQVQGDLSDKQHQNKGINAIKSYCVCMSMTDIKKLLELIKGAQKQLSPLNGKIINRVKRIEMMSQGANIFGDKRDKITGKLFKASKSYALFTDLALPPNLSVDYAKVYRNAFKGSKLKNVVKQVLLSLPDLESYEQFYTSNAMEDFIFSLDIREDSDTLNSIDHIPLKLKIEYLQVLSRGVKMGHLIKEIEEQAMKRFDYFRGIWLTSKQCYLKAISSLNFQNQRQNVKQRLSWGEIKKRKLQQFFAKTQIKLCLTSPKTRSKQIVLKTNIMRDLIEEYRQKLWLQNQNSCIHTALNLDFIKSLTGEAEKSRTKYQCHFSNIMKFPEILCSLPEVKERSSMHEDTLNIKGVFFQFVDFIKSVIRSKENQYSILIQNMEWLEENIQLKIGKKLYDKLYPKYPLYEDIALYLRLKTLDWLGFQHLKIEPELRNWKVWEVAASHLRTIDKLRTAAQKLECIKQTTRIISNSHKLMSKNQKAVSADDFAPLLILVLIMSAPKRLISSINFIQSFASPSKLLSNQGYCLTQIKAALHFCDSVSADGIQIFQNDATNYVEFNKKIYEREIHYGIYFMLGRRKDSPQTQKKKMEYLKEYFKKVQVS